MEKYQPSRVESKWQKQWRKSGAYRIDLTSSGKKFYLLVEFTYPSGDLHMGHWFAFAVPDILSRMKRMQGYTVFAPNGFDAFGLPAENAAISRGVHPSDWTYGNIKRMKQQFETMGAIYDWGHEVITCDPEYYRWNQWIFLKMFERGLAYRAKATSNWCPKDQCVLANENVENGKCWRCGSEIVQKEVEQWFLKITDYAERLIWQDKSEGPERSRGTETISWPKSLKEGQNNWIGKSEGIEILFPILERSDNTSSLILDRSDNTSSLILERSDNTSSLIVGSQKEKIVVFTKFPETIYGVTYMVLAPEHQLVSVLTKDEHKKEVNEYIKRSQKKSELERISLAKEKTGVFTGSYCINPVNGAKVPVWVSDYVIATYGTGAVMGVPGSDFRDFAFANKYDLPIIRVIASKKGDTSEVVAEEDVLEEGYLVNSGQFDGLLAPLPAKDKIMDFLEEKRWGKRKVNYHLHDWSISRQRYWGTPIPVIYCVNCWEVKSEKLKVKSVEGRDFAIIDGKKHAINPVPLDQLPVELPYKQSLRSSPTKSVAGLEVDFAPKGKPPLATASEWVRVKCPNCGSEARREIETMDTFIDSSWYFLRYLRKVKTQNSPASLREAGRAKLKTDEKLPWDPDFVRKWMPVDIYFGGAEHTLGHTLYSRFFVKFLQDIGVVPPMAPTSPSQTRLRGAGEYATRRVHHGVILGPDGRRMSKSRGNVVNPDNEVKQYGADAVRLYLAFLGPYDLVVPWDPGGIRGVYHFLQRVWKLAESVDSKSPSVIATPSEARGKQSKEKIASSSLNKFGTSRNDETTLFSEDLHWMHKAIKKVTEDIESIKFNTAVAALMEWLNYLSGKAHQTSGSVIASTSTSLSVNYEAIARPIKIAAGSSSPRNDRRSNVSLEEYETFLKLLAPFAPHICEELWQVLQSQKSKVKSQKFDSIHQQPWPEYDRELAEAKEVTLVVQVNGKVRDKLLIRAGMAQNEAEKLALGGTKVQKFLGSKKVQKVIFVADRLINLVV